MEEKFEDTKEVISIRKSKKDRQRNGQKKKGENYKQRSTKHYTDNKLSRLLHVLVGFVRSMFSHV
jgi:hypothetical protein